MSSHRSSSEESAGSAGSHVRRKARPCLGCGTAISRGSHDTAAAVFCSSCVERPDPVTAEHYWDLGGNE